MLKIRKNRKVKKFLHSPFMLFLLVIIFFVMAKSLYGAYRKEVLSSANLQREKVELERMKLREKSLISAIDYLKTEQGIEDEIRSKFRAIKSSEKVAVILEDDDEKDSKEEDKDDVEENRGLLYKILGLFW